MSSPRKFTAFDIEDKDGKIISVAFYDETGGKTIIDPDAARRYLFSLNPKGRYFIAHNLEYDLIGLFWDTPYIYKIKFVFGQHLIKAELRENGKRFIFVDSMNYLPIALKKIGDYIDMPKIDIDLKTDNDIKEIRRYNLRDARIVYEYSKRVQNLLTGLGVRYQLTVGSSALHLYAKNYAPFKMASIKQVYYQRHRAAYYGGRVEAFYVGKKKGRFYCYDFNSMFPYVMAFKDYPNYNLYTDAPNLDAPGLTACRVKIPGQYIGPLPYRLFGKSGKQNKIIFPVGKFTGIWANNELNNAIEKYGVEILELYNGFHYEPCLENPFLSYVNRIYNLREKAGPGTLENRIYKLLLNSLYGKFAQRKRNNYVVYHTELPPGEDYTAAEIGNESGFFDVTPKKSIDAPERHSNYIWSVYVTAYARMELLNLLNTARNRGGTIFYCDTDSLITDIKFPTSTALGALKLEFTADYLNIVTNKSYLYGNKVECISKAKGIPKKYAETFLKTGRATFERPLKLKEYLRRADKTNLRPNKWVVVDKIKREMYNKRIVDSNGNTKPIRLRG